MTLTDPPSEIHFGYSQKKKKRSRYTPWGIGPLAALRWAMGFHHFILKQFRLFSDSQSKQMIRPSSVAYLFKHNILKLIRLITYN